MAELVMPAIKNRHGAEHQSEGAQAKNRHYATQTIPAGPMGP
jgi:hypothetical protein